MTHQEFAEKTIGKTPPIKCGRHHVTFGGRCLNCGYTPSLTEEQAKKRIKAWHGRKD